jgi:hypothetical protein
MDPDYANQTDRDALAAVVQLLPERRELVELAFARYAAFREICHDYLACRTALTQTEVKPGEGMTQLEEDLAEEAKYWVAVIDTQIKSGQA